MLLIFTNGARGFLALPKPLFGSECDDNNAAGSHSIMYCCVGGTVVSWLVPLLEPEASGLGSSRGQENCVVFLGKCLSPPRNINGNQ